MADAIILQGRFTSTGKDTTVELRSGIDWMRVYNYTVANASQTTAVGVEYYWQRGFADGYGWEYKKSNAANAANLSSILTSGGFTYVDSSLSPLGAYNSTISAVSNAAIPVATNTGTNGLVAGDVVRLYNVAGAQQLGGYDFTVGINSLSGTTFSLDYMPAIVAGTTGSWRKIKFDPIYYPRHRSITKAIVATSGTAASGNPAMAANQLLVTLSVEHGYKVGQQVRFNIPAAFGMVELDGLAGNIIAVGDSDANSQTNTIRVDIDAQSFTTFSFPLTAAAPFSQALVVPIGMDTPLAITDQVDILSDATVNDGYIGMILSAGANSPAGSANDVIYWIAGKSFSVDNL